MPAAHDTQQRSPFGRLDQRELEYLQLVEIEPFDGWLLVILRVRFDARTKTVTDSIASLARWSGVGERNVQYGLASLQRAGLIRRAKRRVTGGTRGQAWSWTTTLVPYEDWPTEPLVRLIVGTAAYIKVFYPRREEDAGGAPSSMDEGADGARSSLKRTHRTTEEDAQNEGRARTATRDNPDSYPAIFPASSAGEAEQDAPLDGSRPPGNPVGASGGGTALEGGTAPEGASRGGTPGKHVEVALAELGEADYDLVDSRDRPFLVAYAATHPLVDLADEIVKWAGQDGPRTFNGLKAWLENARPAERSRKKDPYCVEPGCLDRGRGSEQRCVRHLGLAS